MTANPAALQLYTVREQLAADRAGVLAQVAALGYGAVEPFGILVDPDGLRADLDAAGLSVCSVHAAPAGEDAEAVVRRRPHPRRGHRDRPVPAAAPVRRRRRRAGGRRAS